MHQHPPASSRRSDSEEQLGALQIAQGLAGRPVRRWSRSRGHPESSSSLGINSLFTSSSSLMNDFGDERPRLITRQAQALGFRH